MADNIVSNLSSPISIMEIAGPQTLQATLIYNFYVPDETVNGKGYPRMELGTSEGSMDIRAVGDGVFNLGLKDTPGWVDMTQNEPKIKEMKYQIQRQIPRYVEISIGGVVGNEFYGGEQAEAGLDALISDMGLTDASKLISLNLGSAHDDAALSAAAASDKFVSLSLQDNNLHTQISREVLNSIAVRGLGQDSYIDTLMNTGGIIDNQVGKDGIMETFLQNALATLRLQNAGVFDIPEADPLMGARQGRTPSEDMAAQNFQCQLSPQCFGDLLLGGLSNAINPFSSDFANDVQLANKITQIYKSVGGTPVEEQFTVPITPLVQSQFQILSDTTMDLYGIEGGQMDAFNSSEIGIIPLGYVVDKFEMLGDGSRFKHRPIILGNYRITTAIDTAIKMGAEYFYQSRAIFLITLPVEYKDGGSSNLTMIRALFLSRPSACIELDMVAFNRPPDPPNDIKFVYDFNDDNLAIHWNFPIEPQRDVRYFQIFRRGGYHEPFQLLKEYDFNDIVEKEPPEVRSELLRMDLIEMMRDNPRTFYIDNDFNKNSSFIYAICSIDAHENMSSYSAQFQVSFDKFGNQLVIEAVSPSGAPRFYPNYFLRPKVEGKKADSILVENAIKVSKHKKFSVYLDPPALKIEKEESGASYGRADVNHLVFAEQLGLPVETGGAKNLINRRNAHAKFIFGKEGRYLMQIINMDNGKTEELNLLLEDVRVPDKQDAVYGNPLADIY